MPFRLLFIILLLHGLGLNAQETTLPEDFLSVIQSHYELMDSDVNHLVLRQQTINQQNGMVHHYYQQQIHDIDIHNAILGLHLLNGELLHHNSRCIPNALDKINTKTASVSAERALDVAFGQLSLSTSKHRLLEQDRQDYIFDKNGHTLSPIPVVLCYWQNEKGDLILAWDLGLEMKDGNHAWRFKIDASSGKILEQRDQMNHCTFDVEHTGGHHSHSHHSHCSSAFFNPDSYEVFPFHVVNPQEGNIENIINPADADASPFGWHDLDGILGAETMVTEGNNCRAFRDGDGDFQPDGTLPNGGNVLEFSFPFDEMEEPAFYQDFSTLQVFYICNIMHDVMYQYGFDEAHGNYQAKNYTGIDGDDDYINALCQYRGDLPEEGDGQTNNRNTANFFAGFGDGSKGRLRTYLYTDAVVVYQRLNILSPSNIMGSYNAGNAQFGPELNTVPLEGEVIQADPFIACGGVTNDLTGKIALVERADCNFSEKVYRCEQAGAIAVIVCNTEDELFNLIGGDFAALVTIPSILISKSDCDKILAELGTGVTVSLQQPITAGPQELDSSLDNIVVMHEYGHGVSHRLTGGRQTISCLDNDEQAGEGWSDFFALAMTSQSTMDGTEARGIGTYLIRRPIFDSGFRDYPYSTDMSINPLTYAFVETESIPHGVGMVWGSMIWDLYWRMIEEYGFDEDMYNGTGGNNRCMQLVMDGMKLQPCSPGFVDARNAILAADIANYNGANQCLIWEVFARRGLGFAASQGSPGSVTDGVEAFDLSPDCITPPEIDGFAVEIYPNPIQGQEFVNIRIASDSDETKLKLRMYNALGQLMEKTDYIKTAPLQQFIFPIRYGYADGFYFLEVTLGNEKKTFKLLKSN